MRQAAPYAVPELTDAERVRRSRLIKLALERQCGMTPAEWNAIKRQGTDSSFLDLADALRVLRQPAPREADEPPRVRVKFSRWQNDRRREEHP